MADPAQCPAQWMGMGVGVGGMGWEPCSSSPESSGDTRRSPSGRRRWRLEILQGHGRKNGPPWPRWTRAAHLQEQLGLGPGAEAGVLSGVRFAA